MMKYNSDLKLSNFLKLDDLGFLLNIFEFCQCYYTKESPKFLFPPIQEHFPARLNKAQGEIYNSSNNTIGPTLA